MIVELRQGDCLVEMQNIPDKSIDMILCDLPYGTTARNTWDSKLPFGPLWDQYRRIIKTNGAILLFTQLPFSANTAASNLKWLRYEWIWKKSQGTGHLNAKKMPMKSHENILVFYDRLPKYNPQMRPGSPYVCKSGRGSTNYRNQNSVITRNTGERYPLDVLEFPSDKGLHPTQKPVALCEYLICTYTDEGETVLDNCMGSGTTGVACVNTGRRFIGMELDEGYFEVAKKRIEDAIKEGKPFASTRCKHRKLTRR